MSKAQNVGRHQIKNFNATKLFKSNIGFRSLYVYKCIKPQIYLVSKSNFIRKFD